jgi:elongation factor G
MNFRTVTVLSPDGTGKSSLVEAMLFKAGALKSFRPISGGPKPIDNEPEEENRGFTLSTHLYTMDWNKTRINVLDTPGYPDFYYDLECALSVSEAAIMVINGWEDVKAQTYIFYEAIRKYNVPAMVVINQFDKEEADFDKTIAALAEVTDARICPIQLPIGAAETFTGVVDLIRGKAILYPDDKSGKAKVGDIPEDLADLAEEKREEMIEYAVEADDELTERYLEGETISDEEMFRGLAAGTAAGLFVPALVVSSTNNIGIDNVLDALLGLSPSPAEHPFNGFTEDGERSEVKYTVDGEMHGVVFKTVVDPFVGKANYVKILSGKITPDLTIYNNRGNKDRVSQINRIEVAEMKKVSEVLAGDIAIITKAKDLNTSDAIAEKEAKLILGVPPTAPVHVMAVIAKGGSDETKISNGLGRLCEEDPSLQMERMKETKELLLKGKGQTQLDVTAERLKNRFKVEMEMKTRLVPYRETIRGTASAQGRHKKQSGGRGQFGDTWQELSPQPRGEGFLFKNAIVGGVIPRNFIPAVEKGVIEAMDKGPLAAYPVIDVQVRLYDGSHHSVDSSEIAFKMAGIKGFRAAFQQADPILLEPINDLEIKVPAAYFGDISGDISSRRGRVMGMDQEGKWQILKAQIPMGEMLTYAPEFQAMTRGEGSYQVSFSHYEECPPNVSQAVISAAKKEAGEEEE